MKNKNQKSGKGKKFKLNLKKTWKEWSEMRKQNKDVKIKKRRMKDITFNELWKTESRCSSQTERLRQQAVEGKLRRSGEWPITPSDSEDVHDGFRRSIWNWRRTTISITQTVSLISKHSNTHLEELLAGQSLSCDQKTLVVAGHPCSGQVLIGQLDIFSMVLQKRHDSGNQGRLILTLRWKIKKYKWSLMLKYNWSSFKIWSFAMTHLSDRSAVLFSLAAAVGRERGGFHTLRILN